MTFFATYRGVPMRVYLRCVSSMFFSAFVVLGVIGFLGVLPEVAAQEPLSGCYQCENDSQKCEMPTPCNDIQACTTGFGCPTQSVCYCFPLYD